MKYISLYLLTFINVLFSFSQDTEKLDSVYIYESSKHYDIGYHNIKKTNLIKRAVKIKEHNAVGILITENNLNNNQIYIEDLVFEVKCDTCNNTESKILVELHKNTDNEMFGNKLLQDTITISKNIYYQEKISLKNYNLPLPEKGIFIVFRAINNTPTSILRVGKIKREKVAKEFIIIPNQDSTPTFLSLSGSDDYAIMVGLIVSKY